MNYKILILIFLFVYSCTVNTANNNKIKTNVQTEFFSNKGFALVFNNDLKKQKLISRKIDDRSLIIFQKNLKKEKSRNVQCALPLNFLFGQNQDTIAPINVIPVLLFL